MLLLRFQSSPLVYADSHRHPGLFCLIAAGYPRLVALRVAGVLDLEVEVELRSELMVEAMVDVVPLQGGPPARA
jgi:hypothetical protein